MKKKVIPKIIFAILAIVLIVMIVLVIIQKPKDLTAQMYNDICQMQNYTFSMKEESLDINYNLTIAKKENSMSIDAISGDEHTTTLVEEDIAYYIIHSDKEYYLYDMSQIDADILKNDLAGIEEEKYENGYEKINGKKYYYEEFEGITTFIMWTNYSEGESSIKTRFYYDNNKIAYSKTIIDNSDEELLKIDFSDQVDNNLFEIPDDYAEL